MNAWSIPLVLWMAVLGDPRTPTETHPVAEATPAPDDGDIQWKWSNGLRFESADKRIKGKFGGRIQFDANFFRGSDELDAAGISTADGVEFRRARLYVSADLYDDFFFKAQYDMAGSSSSETDVRPGFKDVFIGRKDVLGDADLQAGQFKEPFGLDELTSSNNSTFLERALPNLFAPSRSDGAMLSGMACESLWWGAGLFRADTDGSGLAQSDADGHYAATARAVLTPVFEDDGRRIVHLGAAYSRRDVDGVRFRERPEAHLADRLVDTGTIPANDVSYSGIELAGVFGPVHAEAEYMLAATEGPGADLDFGGAYVQAGWFLTGESRPYKRSEGAFDRVVPGSNFGAEGRGAMELALRYSTLDLDDGTVEGGQIDDVTLGFNWYLNPNSRLMFNVVRSEFEAGTLDDHLIAFLVRWQIDW